MKVTYLVLTYGNQAALLKCLQTFRIFHTNDPLIVADNGGPDGQLTKTITENFGGKYVLNPGNESLSKLMNMGIEAAETDFVCMVTQGVEFTTRLTEQFEKDFDRDPLTVMVGGLLMYSDGRIQHGGGRRFWIYGSMGHYGQTKYPHEAKLCLIPAYRIYVTGATAAIRKSFWQDHRYDENLTMSCEDTDMCFRAWLDGKRVYYDPEITSIHNEGATRGRTPEEKHKKAPWLVQREQVTLQRFKEKYTDAQMHGMEKEADRLNERLHPYLPVAFVRNGATGDVLRTLNIYDKLEPKERMVVITQVAEAFRDRECLAITPQMDEYAVSRFIDLDLAYERRRDLSIEHAYANVAFEGIEQWDTRPVPLKTNSYDWLIARNLAKGFEWDKPYVVMHFGVGWPGKTYDNEFWAHIANKVASKGFGLVCIGNGGDSGIQGPKAVNLVGRTSLHTLRAILERAKLYIGNDSGPLHVADGACPAIGLFSVTTPERVVSDKVTGIMTPAPCAGCQLRRPLATNYECDYPEGDLRNFLCTKSFDPEVVVKKAFEMLGVK